MGALRRISLGLGSLALLAGLVAGVPALLLVVGFTPQRAGIESWSDLGIRLQMPDDGTLVGLILTGAAWLAWAYLVAAVAVETVAAIRRIPAVPLPGPGWGQLPARRLVAGAALLFVAGPALTVTVPGPPAFAAPIPSPPSDSPAAKAPDVPTPRTITVERGDSLSSLAREHLGDPGRWDEIHDASTAIVQPGGRRLTDPDQIDVGWTLNLPPDRATDDQPRSIVVQPGDSLSRLARTHLGDQDRWEEIYQASTAIEQPDGRRLTDPDHIEPGWTLRLPTESRTLASTADSPAPELVVETGDEPKEAADPAAEPGAEGHPEASPPQPVPGAERGPTAGRSTEAQESAEPQGTSDPSPPASSGPTAPTASVPDEPPPAASGVTWQLASDTALIGSLGAVVAAGLIGGWQARRLLQSRVRPPGRRVLQPDDGLARLHAAVGRRQLLDHTAVLDSALRAIGRHCHRAGLRLPDLAQATLAADRLSFTWVGPAGPPPAGFEGEQASWWLPLPQDGANPLGDVEHPCALPALVSLGTSDTGETVLIDLERSGVIGVAAEHSELQLASLASIAVELACVPWAAELALVSVGADGELVRAAGGEAVTRLDAEAALVRLRRQLIDRREALAGHDLRRLRTDPERADAVAPQVYVFHDPLTEAQRHDLDELLAGNELGIAAVLPVDSGIDAQWELIGDPLHPVGRFRGAELAAHAIPESTRTALAAWHRVAEATETEPAPWWSDADAANLRLLPSRQAPSEDPVDIVSLRRLVRPHPTLLLIGPIELTGAAGPEPSRARHQLIELCSWLVEHPGRTATEMASGLGIAESTRRSNLSRLRAWLGNDPEDEPYLPEAYSGRIRLHPQVTSDVAQLRLLTGPGVNRIGEDGLVAALDLIRGGVLADAAPGQWYWAESLRSDLTATLRDASLVLVDRALDRGDLDLARWATERALTVAPEDELLLCARIRTEHAAGNRAAVERHVLRLTQQARILGVDLLPQTVMLCQQVMEGRTRVRRA